MGPVSAVLIAGRCIPRRAAPRRTTPSVRKRRSANLAWISILLPVYVYYACTVCSTRGHRVIYTSRFNAVHCLQWIAFRRYCRARPAARLSLSVPRAIARCIETVMRFTHRRNSGDMRSALEKVGGQSMSADAQSTGRVDRTNEFCCTSKKNSIKMAHTRATPAFFSSLLIALTYQSCESDSRPIIVHNSAILGEQTRSRVWEPVGSL